MMVGNSESFRFDRRGFNLRIRALIWQFRKGDRLSVVLGKLFAVSFRRKPQTLRSLHVLGSVSRIQLRKTNALLDTGRLLNLNTARPAFDTFVV